MSTKNPHVSQKKNIFFFWNPPLKKKKLKNTWGGRSRRVFLGSWPPGYFFTILLFQLRKKLLLSFSVAENVFLPDFDGWRGFPPKFWFFFLLHSQRFARAKVQLFTYLYLRVLILAEAASIRSKTVSGIPPSYKKLSYADQSIVHDLSFNLYIDVKKQTRTP